MLDIGRWLQDRLREFLGNYTTENPDSGARTFGLCETLNSNQSSPYNTMVDTWQRNRNAVYKMIYKLSPDQSTIPELYEAAEALDINTQSAKQEASKKCPHIGFLSEANISMCEAFKVIQDNYSSNQNLLSSDPDLNNNVANFLTEWKQIPYTQICLDS